jgi:glycosyltransferase involved in cell wall biosynthesis
MRRVNVHLYQSTFKHESRILKITQSLAKAKLFEDILVIARGDGELPGREAIDANRDVQRLPASLWRFSKSLGLLEWLLRASWHLLQARPACVNCHSLATLPVGVMAKWMLHARLIYDTHELETETAALRGIRKRFYKLVERLLIRYVDEVVVVGAAIANWYKNEYGLRNVHVVRNFPDVPLEPDPGSLILKQSLSIPADDVLFLYQGIVGSGRGIELLLRVFQNAPRGKHLVFIGYGPWLPAVRRAADSCNQIHFVPAVPPAELLRWTAGADVGLSVFENTSLSNFYCVPNKVFEYLACGLPVIVSDFPEMSKFVSDTRCGWTVSVDEVSLQNLVAGITRDALNSKAEQARKHRFNYRWQSEEPTLIRVYQTINGGTLESKAA